jgi:hypothetical protein
MSSRLLSSLCNGLQILYVEFEICGAAEANLRMSLVEVTRMEAELLKGHN